MKKPYLKTLTKYFIFEFIPLLIATSAIIIIVEIDNQEDRILYLASFILLFIIFSVFKEYFKNVIFKSDKKEWFYNFRVID